MTKGGTPVWAMPPQRSGRTCAQVEPGVRGEVERAPQRFVRDHNAAVPDHGDLAFAELPATHGYPTSTTVEST